MEEGGRKNNKGDKNVEVGVRHQKEIGGFHLPAASLRLSAQRVIKDPANRVP